MASTIDKIKAKVDNVLHKDKTHNDPTGPHSSHAANQADPRVDSDRIGTAGNTSGAGGYGAGQYGSNTTGTHTGSGLTGSSGTHGTTGGLGTTHGSDPTGPHNSHLANKADPRVDSDRIGTAGNTSGAGGYGAGQYGSSTTHNTTSSGLTGHGGSATHGSDPSGPHDSRLANKLDPTVDTKSYGTVQPGTGHYANTHGTTGGLTGNTHGTSGYSDPTGPHDSHLANKADPRVDSDRYGTAGNTSGAGGYGAGQYGSNTGSGLTGSHGTHTGTTGSGLTGSHGHSDPTGPHDSHLANKADPRVDSDRYGTAGNTSGAGGYGAGQYGSSTGSGLTGSHGTHTGTTGSGLTGSHGHSDPTGPHNSHLANQADPRVDSDRYGTAGNTSGAGGYGAGQYGSSTTGAHGTHANVGSGNSNTTAGPHNSDLLNKIDPRVDSDLDGSKTYGGNQTHY